MTCIVGLVDNNKVYIGGDSAGVSGLDITVRKDEKVWKKDEFVFGFTSSFRMGQILRYSFNPPECKVGRDIMEYMCTDFINEVRKCLKEGGYTHVSNNVESGGTFLVGFQGRLFRVESDFQVGEPVDNYDACGCGESYALGALGSSVYLSQPEHRVRQALNVASKFSAGVCGPFNVVSV
jgi:ATP-dependent protease HslVU (ClpYQ) peptidase subunit